MQLALAAARWSDEDTAYLISGVIIDRGQQRELYPHFDAFLASTHAVPFIIRCCFGHDGHRALRDWFDGLTADERERRDAFSRAFSNDFGAFLARPLSGSRNTSQHRRGYATDIVARYSNRFGVTYVGDPTKPIPISETIVGGPGGPMFARERPVELRADHFSIDGRPLLEICQERLNAAQTLAGTARTLVGQVHGTRQLTQPPDT